TVSLFVSASASVSVSDNIHVCPSHTERQQLQNYPLATRCLHHFVRAVSKGFESSREGKMVMYHGHQRSCG
ncbi:hypothetical protein BDR05DRAFT_961423, partial [Suillus weaverae]